MKINPTGARARGLWLSGLAACALLLGGQAEAASQGSLGATSQGSIAITLSVAARVQLSGLTDVDFVAVSPDSAATRAQSVCVWSNTATKGYGVTAEGSGPGNSFVLANESRAAAYSVAWKDTAGQTAGIPLSPGGALSGLTSTATSSDCASTGDASATLLVKVDAVDLQNAQPDTIYVGTLNLVVTPE